MQVPHQLILSSSSPARRKLMAWLKIPFECMSPNIDETPFADEDIITTVKRLSIDKAKVSSKHFPEAFIIGCDQLGMVGQTILCKPKDHQDAIEQLRQQSGNEIIFYTAISLLNPHTQTIQTDVVEYRVYFRNLKLVEIEDYLKKDQPYHCAGSLRADGLGITLIDHFAGEDFTALVGLPMIKLSQMLRAAGYPIY